MPPATSAERTEQRLWTLLLGSSVLYFFSANEADNDLWGHLLFGRAILAAGGAPPVDTYAYTTLGRAWVNHEWLSQALLAAVYQAAGSAGLLFLKLGVAAATCLLVCRLIRAHSAAPFVWGPTALLCFATLARGFAIRPQIFTYLGVAAALVMLDRYEHGSRRILWWFPALFVVWANLHGGFVLGLAILAVFAGADFVRDADRSLRPWFVLIASAAVTALNPHGWRLLAFIWNELSRTHPITEWQPASLEAAHFAFYTMLAVFVLTLPLVRDWRKDGWPAVLAVIVAFFAVRHQRHTPVFALCAAAPLATQMQNLATWIAQRSSFALSTAARRVVGVALVALAALQIGLTSMRYRRDGLQIVYDPMDYPTAAVSVLGAAGVHGNLAVPLDWGEYVLWFLTPQVKVSLDGRFATLFPERVVEDNFAFFSGEPGWQRLVEQYPTDAALVPTGSPCPVGTLSGWEVAVRTPDALVYARTSSPMWSELQRRRATAPPEPVHGIFP